MKIRHSGFIAIIGRANVGKSTLLNAILGEKLAAVSAKPQTTRNRITGVYTKNETQIVFLDTPGFHRPRNRLGEYMVKTVSDSILDVDAAIFVVEPVEGANDYEKALLDKFRSAAIPVILVINKIDTLAQKQQLAGVIQTWSERFDFHAIVPASAARCEGIADVVKEAVGLMPEGPQYYPEDMFTTEPERAVVAEIIREKLLRLMSEEIPHGTAVSIERMKEREEGGVIDIDAVIFCEKESHKGMIIGKGGQMLKKVGSQARMDIERLLDCHVNLKLWVKVKEDWRNRESILKSLGYE